MKHQYYRLEALTPVHIGTGESLDPFSYVIKDGELHYIDLTGWVEAHPDPEGLARKLSGEVHAVRAHIAETIDLEKYSLSKARVLSKEVQDEYRRRLRDPRNQLKIAPALKNAASCSLVIPGSSIKGAIRTAVIDMLDREYGLGLRQATANDDQQRTRTRQYEDCLKSALGDIGSNAFKNLKVSDFEAPSGASAVIAAREVGKKPDKQPTPKDPCEVLPGSCMGGDGIRLPGKIGIGESSAINPKGESLDIGFAGKRISLSTEQMAALCSSFYRRRFLEEKKTFYALPHFARTARALEAVEKAVLEEQPGVFLLRIGHYSHVECMTITDNKPQTRRVNGRIMPFGTTRTLADGIYPFGWIRLVPCTAGEYHELLSQHASITETACHASRQTQTAPVISKPTIVTETLVWDGATLAWLPGNSTLVATREGKKAELKLGANRSLVPESMHGKLFKKKEAAKGKVTLEKDGNMLKITKIEAI
jgi:hypothetical protein